MLMAPARPATEIQVHSLHDYLEKMIEKEASDLHLVPGKIPQVRVGGDLVPLEDAAVFTADAAEQLIVDLRGEVGLRELDEQKDVDFAYEKDGAGRFRVNVSIQRGVPALTLRRIHSSVPNMEGLGLPPVCRMLATKPRGLILVTGPVNSGKSTTMAAMIEYVSSSLPKRIVTLEDPVEYVYSPGKSLITQRELGTDVLTFASGLRSALRQDPDVILVGEMRDPETVAACLMAAETGHLVMSTLHTPSAAQAVDRLVDMFPAGQQELIRHRLASLIEGVLYQVLVQRRDDAGRVLAAEVMLGTPAVRALIRDGRTHQLPNVIHTSRETGMQTVDQALLFLHQRRLISSEDLLLYCSSPEEMSRIAHVDSGA